METILKVIYDILKWYKKRQFRIYSNQLRLHASISLGLLSRINSRVKFNDSITCIKYFCKFKSDIFIRYKHLIESSEISCLAPFEYTMVGRTAHELLEKYVSNIHMIITLIPYDMDCFDKLYNDDRTTHLYYRSLQELIEKCNDECDKLMLKI